MKGRKVRLLDKLESKQVVVWKVDWVRTNESSSALQYTAVPWLQVKLKFICCEFLRACGFSLHAFGPPDFLGLDLVCGQWSVGFY